MGVLIDMAKGRSRAASLTWSRASSLTWTCQRKVMGEFIKRDMDIVQVTAPTLNQISLNLQSYNTIQNKIPTVLKLKQKSLATK